MDLASAFQRGDKEAAVYLLPCTDDIANIWTWFSSSTHYFMCYVSLLHLAAYHGWLDVIDNLITIYGFRVHHTDSKGHSLLHYAASEGHLEVVRHLISEYNCDPSCVNDIGNTPLHIASIVMVISRSSSASSVRHTVTHHVRTILVIHHFTLLVVMVTSASSTISSVRNTATQQL